MTSSLWHLSGSLDAKGMDRLIMRQSGKRRLGGEVLCFKSPEAQVPETPGALWCGFQTAFSLGTTFNRKKKVKQFTLAKQEGCPKDPPASLPWLRASLICRDLCCLFFLTHMGCFLGWNMDTRVKVALVKWSIPWVQYFFIHLWLDCLQTEFETAHKVNMVKISPQTIITELKEKLSNERHGNEENYIQKQDWERFLLLSIKFCSWETTE